MQTLSNLSQSFQLNAPQKPQKITQLKMTVSHDHLYAFFLLYERLGAKARRIFNCIQWFCLQYKNSFPSQGKIAENAGCSREYVNKVMKKFFEYGWLVTTSRGSHRSKMIHMDDLILMIDTTKKCFWKRAEFTTEFTHIFSYEKREYFGEESRAREKEKWIIRKKMESLNCPLTESLKMQAFPIHIVDKTLGICRSMGSKVHTKGISSEKQPAYMVGIAMNLAKRDGISPDWGGYYRDKMNSIMRN